MKIQYIYELLMTLLRDGRISSHAEVCGKYIKKRSFERYVNTLKDLTGANLTLTPRTGIYSLSDPDKKRLRKSFGFTTAGQTTNDSQKQFLAFLQKINDKMELFSHEPIPGIADKNIEGYENVITVARPPVSKFPVSSDDIKRILQYTANLERIKFQYYRYAASQKYPVELIPYVVHFVNGKWYLIGKETKSGHIKKYLLEKISALESREHLMRMTPAEAARRETARREREAERTALIAKISESGNIFFNSEEKPTAATVRFGKDVAHYFDMNDYGYKQSVKKRNADGSVDVSFQFTSFFEFWFFIAPWLNEAVILSPKEYKDDVVAFLKTACERMG